MRMQLYNAAGGGCTHLFYAGGEVAQEALYSLQTPVV